MTLEITIALLFGILVGAGFGCWRTMVYARKLRHFDINLDKWAHYDEHTAQARRGSVPTKVPFPANRIIREGSSGDE